MPDHRYDQYLKEVDYIRTRVFPWQLCTLYFRNGFGGSQEVRPPPHRHP